MINGNFLWSHGKCAVGMSVGINPASFFDNFITNMTFLSANKLTHGYLSYFAKFRRKKIACKKRFEEKREMNKKIATPRNTMRSEKNGNIDREEFISSSYVWTRAIV